MQRLENIYFWRSDGRYGGKDIWGHGTKDLKCSLGQGVYLRRQWGALGIFPDMADAK